MRLTREQRYALLEKHGCYVTEVCDKCSQIIGPVRFTRRDDKGVWCSRECRDGAKVQLYEVGINSHRQPGIRRNHSQSEDGSDREGFLGQNHGPLFAYFFEIQKVSCETLRKNPSMHVVLETTDIYDG